MGSLIQIMRVIPSVWVLVLVTVLASYVAYADDAQAQKDGTVVKSLGKSHATDIFYKSRIEESELGNSALSLLTRNEEIQSRERRAVKENKKNKKKTRKTKNKRRKKPSKRKSKKTKKNKKKTRKGKGPNNKNVKNSKNDKKNTRKTKSKKQKKPNKRKSK